MELGLALGKHVGQHRIGACAFTLGNRDPQHHDNES
jgi:hypothetical protein